MRTFRSILIAGLILVFAGYAWGQFVGGEYWQNDKYAPPYHLFYTSCGSDVAIWDSNSMLTCDPGLQWDTLNVKVNDNDNGIVSYSITNTSGGASAGAALFLNNTIGTGEVTLFSPAAGLADALLIRGSHHSVVIQAPDATNGTVEVNPGNGVFLADWMTGSGTRCVQVSSTGQVTPASGPCASGGTGTVTNVTGTAPIFIAGTSTVTPNVTIQGAIVSGSASTSAQDLGLISTSMLACSTAAGVCTVDGVTVTGGLAFNTGTATETLANSSTCGSLQAVGGSTTSGLTCDPITGPAANGVAYFDATADLDEDAANFGWNDSTRIMSIGTTTAPSAPGPGVLVCWADSTGLDLTCKNTGGTVTHGVQTQAGAAHNFATSISAAGAVGLAQPAFSDLSGSQTCTQTPAFTGQSTKPSGSCVTTNVALTDSGSQAWTFGTWADGEFARFDVGGGKFVAASNIVGDGTSISCSNTGLPPENLTCSMVSVGTAGTYLSVTTNSKGQVTAGSAAPAANDVIFSNGPGSAPAGDATFTWDGANKSIVLTSLDSGLTDAYPTAVSTTGLISRVPVRTLSIPFHVTFVPNTFGSAIKWLMTTSDSATSGSQVSYTGGSVYKYWRLTVATDQFGVTTGGYGFDVTMNGSSIGSVAVSAVGVHTNNGTTGSTLTTDSYGVRLNSSAAGATTNLDSVVLELSTYQFP